MATHAGGLRRTAALLPSLILERLSSLDGVAPAHAAERFRDLPGFGLLESARPGRASRWSILVADPLDVLVGSAAGRDPFAEARLALRRFDPTRLPAGGPPFAGGVVGYLGYDLGRRLELVPAHAIDDQGLPDLRLGLYSWAIAWDRRDGQAWLAGRAVDGDRVGLARTIADVRERVAGIDRAPVLDAAPQARAGSRAPAGERLEPGTFLQPGTSFERGPFLEPGTPLDFVSGTDRATWERSVNAVRAAIAAGELYQANLARRLTAPFDGDPWAVFRRLRVGEPAAFGAYLDLGPDDAMSNAGGPHGAGLGGGPDDPATRPRRAIVSASPEPFLALAAAGTVRTDPIKGTRPRGRTRVEDRALAAELLASAKDRAENTMIVDVLRNDLGRVCLPGSVRVPRLWRLERTPSVQHLVSTIAGRLTPGRDAFDLLAATFPGGSVTGAPKIRAMQLIEALEPVRRGPYCGAALWVDAAGAMGSSILIRTFVADGRRLTLHVGGGITWRSDPAAEWEETRVKARGPLRAIGGRISEEEEQ